MALAADQQLRAQYAGDQPFGKTGATGAGHTYYQDAQGRVGFGLVHGSL